MFTLQELKDIVDDLIEEVDQNQEDPNDVKVRLAIQPSWPLEFDLGSLEMVMVQSDGPDSDRELEEYIHQSEEDPNSSCQLCGEEFLVENYGEGALEEAVEHIKMVHGILLGKRMVYIVQGSQRGYVPGYVCDQIGWSGRSI